MKNSKLSGAVKISSIYFVAGCIWIFSSDKMLSILIPDRNDYAVFQTYKGWIFILVSALLLFILLYKELKKRDIIESDLIKNINEKRVLLNEIHHRVNNNLNSIIALLYLEKSNATSEDSRNIIEALSGRIHSMALVHENLYKSGNYESISLKNYIPGVVSYIRGMFSSVDERVKFECSIGEISLELTRAIPFGILLNEIISNSFKHAFPGSNSGTISIELNNDGDKCTLLIGDNGIGMQNPADLSPSDTHGLELIRLLVKQLSGDITINGSGGVKYKIVFPVNY